ncbi:MAG: hypothetical protein OMM_13665, partial [Candidatus Magnetoglobus multicellularis str. Araruama]
MGKTSILKFLEVDLPENLLPIFLDSKDLQFSSSVIFLKNFFEKVKEEALKRTGVDLEIPDETSLKSNPSRVFDGFFARFKKKLPEHTPFLMINEFQDLLRTIARTGSDINQDTLVLDLLHNSLDQRQLFAIFTGYVRFETLGRIVKHLIFGSISPMRISFLSKGNVGNVLREGLKKWVKVPEETINSVFELTGGYPWLVQLYGSKLVDLLNDEHRTVATPEDIRIITDTDIINTSSYFEFWWSTDQLGMNEERFIERLLSNYADYESVSIKEFFNDIRYQENSHFRRHFKIFVRARCWSLHRPGLLNT